MRKVRIDVQIGLPLSIRQSSKYPFLAMGMVELTSMATSAEF
jgi:hypothetical protein